MLIKVFCVLNMLNKLPPGVCWRGGGGGGGNRLPGLVAKQQAVEFPQVQTSLYNIIIDCHDLNVSALAPPIIHTKHFIVVGLKVNCWHKFQ